MNDTTTNELSHAENTTASAAKTSLDIINAVYPPLLIVVGVTCNVFVILVMRTKYFRCQPSSVFMVSGAVNDGLSLVLSMTTHWLYVTFDGIYYKNDVKSICKFLDFYGWGNCDFGILLTTAMMVERALAIKFPFKRLSCNATKKNKIIVIILLIITIAKDFHFLIGSDMVEEGRQERLCDVFPGSASYRMFWKQVWPWLHLSFLIVCIIVIVVSNTVLVQEVWKAARIEKTLTLIISNNNRKRNKSFAKMEKQWRTMTPMLIGESFVLLILTFPFTIQLSISGYNPEFYKSFEMGLLFSVTFYMLYTNKCVNFFVYLVTGQMFRKELAIVLKNCFCGFMNSTKFCRKLVHKRSLTTRGNIDNRFSCAEGKTLSVWKTPDRKNDVSYTVTWETCDMYDTYASIISEKSESTHL